MYQDGRSQKNKNETKDKVCAFSQAQHSWLILLDMLLIEMISYRDYDQVRADLADPKHLAQYKATKDAEDLPGLGQYYCVECAKWFEGEHNLIAHRKGKNHKRR